MNTIMNLGTVSSAWDLTVSLLSQTPSGEVQKILDELHFHLPIVEAIS